MTHANVPMIFVFLGFSVVSGLIAYYCWWVIQRSRRQMAIEGQSRWEHFRSVFTVVVMIVPLVGFAFEFLYFLSRMFLTLASIVSP